MEISTEHALYLGSKIQKDHGLSTTNIVWHDPCDMPEVTDDAEIPIIGKSNVVIVQVYPYIAGLTVCVSYREGFSNGEIARTEQTVHIARTY